MKAIAMIPARLGSTRFPRKVLAAATGRPLIQHVWERARVAARVARVIVATDAPEVVDAVRAFGGESVLTSEHPNGTSRLAEAAGLLGLPDDAMIVNVQGDEPEIEPGVIDAAVDAAARLDVGVGTVASPFGPGEDPRDPNVVKVVLAADGSALYFSRALIPFPREGGEPAAPLRHVGIYAYRAGMLRRYLALEPSPAERSELLEQLRLLHHGVRIGVAVRDVHASGIDTPAQYDAFVARWTRTRA
jgi:3-deoxy-manno-octulosonate cytidylyltransferase (CMP-KDO synthetase)